MKLLLDTHINKRRSTCKIKEIAKNLHMTPEDLVRVSIDELLSRPDEDFQKAVEHVLKKNIELYRRLA